jgi:hypothetical protein
MRYHCLSGVPIALGILVGAAACGSDAGGPPESRTYLVGYHLTLDPSLVVDSLHYRNGLRTWGPATDPIDGWSVAFSLASGDSLEAIAWLSASGPGDATLQASWTVGSDTEAATESVSATAPGRLTLVLPPTRLP